MNYQKTATIMKALADVNRLKIIDLLSEGSLCGCKVLEHFDFTQPTLSHHMKVLEKAGIVSVQKRGQWHYYQLEREALAHFMVAVKELTSKK